MQHIFKPGKKGMPVFVTLHGTGGDENNLLPLAEALNPDYGVLGVRGEVNEQGMLRFFKRKAEGVQDEEDLALRGKQLYDFIQAAGHDYDFAMEDVILVGFSNGANIAINLLLQPGHSFKRAILMASMYPVEIEAGPDLSDVNIFLSMGEKDPIVPVEASKHVIDIFQSRGADVSGIWVKGHELNAQVLMAAKQWLNQL